MAKKKAATTEKEPGIPAWKKKLAAEYGDVFIPAQQILERKRRVIPVSPNIDLAIGGGIPEGSWVIFSGPAKCGKSTTALQFCANAQKEEFGNKNIIYLDIEGRFKPMNLKGVHGLNVDKFELIQSRQGHFLSAEQNLDIAVEYVKNMPGCVLVLDSSSALCASSEIDGKITANMRNSGPKLLASFCRKLGTIVPVQNSIVIIIQHLIANTSGFGAPFMEDGGNKIKYQKDVHLRCKGIERWKDKNEVQIGQIVNWEVVCAALGPPGIKTKSWLRYGYGLDSTMEVINLGLDLGLIDKPAKSSWITLAFLDVDEPLKIQGVEKVHAHLVDNPKHLSLLTAQIKEML